MRLAIGVGCKSDATAEAILRIVEAALARAGDAAPVDSAVPTGLYSHARKAGHLGLAAAAAALGLPLRLFAEAELRASEPRLVSRSPRVAALAGVGSVAEAAALRGAGERARLVVAKFSAEGVSCAIAAGDPA